MHHSSPSSWLNILDGHYYKCQRVLLHLDECTVIVCAGQKLSMAPLAMASEPVSIRLASVLANVCAVLSNSVGG